MKSFSWGRVEDVFVYDFDGEYVEVTKYRPNKYINSQCVRGEYEEYFEYHIEELHESSDSLFSILIAYIARKQLGLNQGALVSGICKALEVK